jgi:hypothetical protein
MLTMEPMTSVNRQIHIATISKTALLFSAAITLLLTGQAQAQDYVNNTSSDLSQGTSWTNGVIPGSTTTASWNSGQLPSSGAGNNSNLITTFTTAAPNVTWDVLQLAQWTQINKPGPVLTDEPINLNESSPSDVITLAQGSTLTQSNFALVDNNILFNVANLNVGATTSKWQLSAPFEINDNTHPTQASIMSITGALTEATDGSTLDISGGGLLALTGSSNTITQGAHNAGGSNNTAGQLNLELDGANLAFGNNGTNNFGSLVLNNTFVQPDGNIQDLVGEQSVALGTGISGTINNPANIGHTSAPVNGLPAITAPTQEFFNGTLNPAYTGTSGVGQYINAFQPGANVLTVYGWQGQIGDKATQQAGSTGTGGTFGQLLFSQYTSTTTSLPLDTIVTSVIFDLSDNVNGADSTTIGSTQLSNGHDIPNFSADGLLSNQDYGEWIASPYTGYDELVPYWGPVPEPSTIVASVALLGLLAWRERRRFSALYVQFAPETPTSH